jgi:hypothetical protein
MRSNQCTQSVSVCGPIQCNTNRVSVCGSQSVHTISVSGPISTISVSVCDPTQYTISVSVCDPTSGHASVYVRTNQRTQSVSVCIKKSAAHNQSQCADQLAANNSVSVWRTNQCTQPRQCAGPTAIIQSVSVVIQSVYSVSVCGPITVTISVSVTNQCTQSVSVTGMRDQSVYTIIVSVRTNQCTQSVSVCMRTNQCTNQPRLRTNSATIVSVCGPISVQSVSVQRDQSVHNQSVCMRTSVKRRTKTQ